MATFTEHVERNSREGARWRSGRADDRLGSIASRYGGRESVTALDPSVWSSQDANTGKNGVHSAVKVLVTGAAGFIGFHVTRCLLSEGHSVVGMDNFNDYYSVALKRDRHSLLERESGYTGVEADLADFERLTAVVSEHRPERVCHLAAQAGVRYSVDHPFVYLKSNLEGFLNMLEACRHASPQPRLVYASSSSVYGGSAQFPSREADRVDSPVSLYAATKKADELMAHSYSHLYGLQTVGLRLFTVYGPWGRPDMAMWLFADAMLKGETIRVFNHGDMRRDFTYVGDIVRGIQSALFTEGLATYEVLNIGNHRSEKLMDMIQVVADSLGVEPKMELLPLQPGDIPVSYADITLAQEKLGFEPTTPISVGIPRFIQWLLAYRSGEWREELSESPNRAR